MQNNSTYPKANNLVKFSRNENTPIHTFQKSNPAHQSVCTRRAIVARYNIDELLTLDLLSSGLTRLY